MFNTLRELSIFLFSETASKVKSNPDLVTCERPSPRARSPCFAGKTGARV